MGPPSPLMPLTMRSMVACIFSELLSLHHSGQLTTSLTELSRPVLVFSQALLADTWPDRLEARHEIGELNASYLVRRRMEESFA